MILGYLKYLSHLLSRGVFFVIILAGARPWDSVIDRSTCTRTPTSELHSVYAVSYTHLRCV